MVSWEKLVLTCIEKKIPLDELPLEEYRKISPVFEEDIYKAIDLETCVNKRVTIGAPGKRCYGKINCGLSEIYGRILKYTFINTSTCHTDEGSVRLY